MKKISKWLLIMSILTGSILVRCNKDDDFPEQEEDIPEEIPEASDVNKFIWESMAIYYYWVDNVPNLINPKFNNDDSLNYFLNQYSDPEELFTSLLYRHEDVDRWSELFDDHTQMDEWLSGISESMGFVAIPYQIGKSNDVTGQVIYVLKGTPADKAGIKRGDFFLKINDTRLTLTNYWELISSPGTNTIHMADLSDDHKISLNGVTHTITSEVIQENPVFMDTILNVDSWKVGYLVYNGFTSAYDEKLGTSYDLLLNDVFNDFKNAGINKLIIDLRNNLGGSVQSAVYLASMIHSTDESKVFAKTQYNDLIEKEIIKYYGEDALYDYFTGYIRGQEWEITDSQGKVTKTFTTPGSPVANLDMDEIYVITSNNTVSASELLINGLSPYITVKTVGTNTRGKNVGSWPLKDEIDEEGNLNPNHSYSMMLIVAKIANSEGYSEYIYGLEPDIEASEDIRNLMPFGDPGETLLKVALNDIRGITTKSVMTADKYFSPLKISKEHHPLSIVLNDYKKRMPAVNFQELMQGSRYN
jgi:carboxyl-terminal processing protease